jgi:hypothetical protein
VQIIFVKGDFIFQPRQAQSNNINDSDANNGRDPLPAPKSLHWFTSMLIVVGS